MIRPGEKESEGEKETETEREKGDIPPVWERLDGREMGY
jgi:hypothetical protein